MSARKQQGRPDRLLENFRRRASLEKREMAAIARRRFAVLVSKRVLPVAALALLVALAAAPSWKSAADGGRVTYHVQDAQAAGSHMQNAKYHGLDQSGQPFTVTALAADDEGADDVALTGPEGDLTTKSGGWLMLKSDTGLYNQKSQKLGLTGNVTLYRNDGITMTAPDATIDVRSGDAQSDQPVQVQGPFGTITAQNGFTALNRGTDVTFKGPAALTLTQVQ
jgi:lipopolysaccharide export system protein LptC